MVSIIIGIIIIIILSAISTIFSNSRIKGYIGEKTITNILGKTLHGQKYIINDLLFIDKSGHSCQIDHICINKHGIWVIETKNFGGKIFGSKYQKEWVQKFPHSKKNNNFYNPILQNKTHILRLSEYLNICDIFVNIVVFTNRADISKISAPNVIYPSKLKAVLCQCTGKNLSLNEMEHYYNKLLDLKNKKQITKDKHIKNINEIQFKISNNICPRCGDKLIVRNGRNGNFYGCSNYPKCKFTKNIKD